MPQAGAASYCVPGWVGVTAGLLPGVGLGVLVGLLVRVGVGVPVGPDLVLVGATVVAAGSGVSVGDAGEVTEGDSCGLTVPSTGVTVGTSPGVGVFVGARVGNGAWVGVATNVLPGSTIVEGDSGVGAVVWVGGTITVLSAIGLRIK